MAAGDELFMEERADRAPGELFVVDVDGFEGPLDLLLTLARTHKVDLSRISILALVEQYLAFIAEARRLRLELAADYLVMAAWLAYLKSRLLIPIPEDDEPSGEELAETLAFRLKRLEAMRDAAVRLVNRNRLGRDIFPRGMPEGVTLLRHRRFDADLYELLRAYADQRQRGLNRNLTMKPRSVWTLQEARRRLERLFGEIADWTPIDHFLAQFMDDPEMRAGIIASSFGASLELVREGRAELRQERPFAPLFVRRKN
ncbi:MAG: segregation/condensation protein A [Rhodobiaceae bacterium]|nr:segregation/condensation protein A [Rhodobiaceae bacterium]MCC0057056.1 segregation/condensation protein A [Rhodobiaceae bacterium]